MSFFFCVYCSLKLDFLCTVVGVSSHYHLWLNGVIIQNLRSRRKEFGTNKKWPWELQRVLVGLCKLWEWNFFSFFPRFGSLKKREDKRCPTEYLFFIFGQYYLLSISNQYLFYIYSVYILYIYLVIMLYIYLLCLYFSLFIFIYYIILYLFSYLHMYISFRSW